MTVGEATRLFQHALEAHRRRPWCTDTERNLEGWKATLFSVWVEEHELVGRRHGDTLGSLDAFIAWSEQMCRENGCDEDGLCRCL